MLLRNLSLLAWGISASSDSANDTAAIALFSMIAALGVAVIGVAGQVILAKLNLRNSSTPGNGSRRTAVSREHESWERWLLANGLDPRKIVTGYETVEEVRRVEG